MVMGMHSIKGTAILFPPHELSCLTDKVIFMAYFFVFTVFLLKHIVTKTLVESCCNIHSFQMEDCILITVLCIMFSFMLCVVFFKLC